MEKSSEKLLKEIHEAEEELKKFTPEQIRKALQGYKGFDEYEYERGMKKCIAKER